MEKYFWKGTPGSAPFSFTDYHSFSFIRNELYSINIITFFLVLAKNGIVIAVEKKQKSPLYENSTINKVSRA